MTRYVIDPSFCLRKGFVECLNTLTKHPRDPVVVPAVSLAWLEQCASKIQLDNVQHAAGQAVAAIQAARGKLIISGAVAQGSVIDAESNLQAVTDAALLLTPAATRVIVLTRHPQTVIEIETRRKQTPAENRIPLQYGSLPTGTTTPALRPSWYDPGVLPPLLRRLLGARPRDPSPAFTTAGGAPVGGLTKRGQSGVEFGPGATVFTLARRPLTLGSRVGRPGREGSVYQLKGEDRLVCKILTPEKRTPATTEKLQRMVRPTWSDQSVAWPVEVVVGPDGSQAVGVLEGRAPGEQLSTLLLDRPDEFQTEFGWWTRRHSVAVALRLAEAVSRLHGMGVVVGDLSASNVLLDPGAIRDGKAGGVSVIDCDSFQIEKYPCTVGQEAYTRKQLQGVPFDQVLREPRDDCFALAVLLFQLLVPGRHPFQRLKSGGGEKEWIAEGRFPYPEDLATKFHNTEVPHPLYLFAWTHLPDPIRLLFLQAFALDRPPPAAEWLNPLAFHELELYDPQSVYRTPIRRRYDLSIFPERPYVR